MENPPTILTQADREQLVAWLQQQTQQDQKDLLSGNLGARYEFEERDRQ